MPLKGNVRLERAYTSGIPASPRACSAIPVAGAAAHVDGVHLLAGRPATPRPQASDTGRVVSTACWLLRRAAALAGMATVIMKRADPARWRHPGRSASTANIASSYRGECPARSAASPSAPLRRNCSTSTSADEDAAVQRLHRHVAMAGRSSLVRQGDGVRDAARTAIAADCQAPWPARVYLLNRAAPKTCSGSVAPGDPGDPDTIEDSHSP